MVFELVVPRPSQAQSAATNGFGMRLWALRFGMGLWELRFGMSLWELRPARDQGACGLPGLAHGVLLLRQNGCPAFC